MKRSFSNYLEELDAKERKSVARQQNVHDREDDFSYGTSSERRPISTDMGRDNQDGFAGVRRHANNERPSGQGDKVEKALLEKIEQNIAVMNGGLAPRTDTEEGAKCPGPDSADDAPLSATSSPCLQRSVDKETNAEETVRSPNEATTGGPSNETESDDTEPIDWDSVPITQAICCRWPENVWTEELEREMTEATLLPLPDEDEDDGSRMDGATWVFKRAGHGI
ncbi:uncharacterized protein N0V89_000693 [Didymosphaeria variabile]|uniref:Uncharacterized protein n=1 Tax=Didymosphaeria variabile TaxID=1932322 RepID=A0A9W8XV56_9PLEO|nr:uncharacterized protein N0V89_000693 [Didymosphaeria variabile]KAJ4360133.1 hypothetical protein N0V89_000693 [Didymosphaeria variabile]